MGKQTLYARVPCLLKASVATTQNTEVAEEERKVSNSKFPLLSPKAREGFSKG